MGLKQTLGAMLSQAKRTGETVRVRLAKGLTVSIRINGDLVDLQLSRATVYPATQEWKTIIAQWPVQCVVTKPPKTLKDTTIYYLQGQVRLVEELIHG